MATVEKTFSIIYYYIYTDISQNLILTMSQHSTVVTSEQVCGYVQCSISWKHQPQPQKRFLILAFADESNPINLITYVIIDL